MTFLEELLKTAVRDGDITVNISRGEPDPRRFSRKKFGTLGIIRLTLHE